MTRFLHARLHRSRLRDVVAAHLAADAGSPRPVMAIYPTCGDAFFADPTRVGHRSALEVWEALAKLDGECPDHPHWFTVGPFRDAAGSASTQLD
jgi:hypothetical protein